MFDLMCEVSLCQPISISDQALTSSYCVCACRVIWDMIKEKVCWNNSERI